MVVVLHTSGTLVEDKGMFFYIYFLGEKCLVTYNRALMMKTFDGDGLQVEGREGRRGDTMFLLYLAV